MTQNSLLITLLMVMLCIVPRSGAQSQTKALVSGISVDKFAKLAGQDVLIYTLRNSKGIELRVMNYGGIIISLNVPDREGRSADIVLGFDNFEGYEGNSPYFGAIIGRYANRIANGEFSLEGNKYKLAKNNGTNSLHGGTKGFDKVLWRSETIESEHSRGIAFTYVSKNGEEGYPGTLKTTVVYTLTDNNELILEYQAITDKASPVNLSQHSYFNLAGEGSKDVLSHVLTINADRFTPVDKTLIPTGELRTVRQTPFDFTKPTAMGAHVDENEEQLTIAGGYDHNFVINKSGLEPSLAARVYEPASGRVIEVYTDQPGLQFYSGNFLDGSIKGKHGHRYGRRSGFCLEAQHFPDSPNHPNFPSTILKPGEVFRSKTIYKFPAPTQAPRNQ